MTPAVCCRTRGELDEAEALNIVNAVEWLESGRINTDRARAHDRPRSRWRPSRNVRREQNVKPGCLCPVCRGRAVEALGRAQASNLKLYLAISHPRDLVAAVWRQLNPPSHATNVVPTIFRIVSRPTPTTLHPCDHSPSSLRQNTDAARTLGATE